MSIRPPAPIEMNVFPPTPAESPASVPGPDFTSVPAPEIVLVEREAMFTVALGTANSSVAPPAMLKEGAFELMVRPLFAQAVVLDRTSRPLVTVVSPV